MSEEEDIVSEVLSASIGGAISASMLYPLEVLKTKMQAETTSSKKTDANDEGNAENKGDEEEEDDDDDLTKLNMVDYARHLYKTQGLKVFFSGFETSAFQSASEKALYFFAYTSLKNLYRTLLGDGSTPTSIVSLLLGCCAEWAHLPLTLPLDCWTTAIQTNRDSTKGPMQLLLNLLSEKGMMGMYKGIQAYTILCLKPALQYTIFEKVKATIVSHRRDGRLLAAEAFALGMVARTISTVVIYPFIRAKVVLQTSSCDLKGRSIPQMLLDMYNVDGVSSWFQGLGPELARGVLSSALMLMIKDQIGFIVKKAIAAPRVDKTTKLLRN